MSDSPSPALKSIGVFLDSRGPSRTRLNVALRLATLHGSHITGIFTELSPSAPAGAAAESFARGSGMTNVADHYHEDEERERREQRTLLEGAAGHAGLGTEWRELGYAATLDDAVTQCRYVDLVVLPPSTPLHRNDRAMFWSSGHVVLAAGVPCLFIPEEYTGDTFATRVVIGWNATPQARRAISDALSFLLTAQSVTVVIIDPRIGAGAHGAVPGFDIAQLLGRHGIRVDVQQVASRGSEKGDVLLTTASALSADLVVAGAFGHSRVVEFVLGSTTRGILERSRIPVLLSH